MDLTCRYRTSSGREASSIWSGRRGSAALTTHTCVTWSSTSCWVAPSIFCGTERTTPSTSMTDSFVILQVHPEINNLLPCWFPNIIHYPAVNLTNALLIDSDTAKRHCTVDCCWRSKKKHCFPLALLVCSLPLVQIFDSMRDNPMSSTLMIDRSSFSWLWFITALP